MENLNDFDEVSCHKRARGPASHSKPRLKLFIFKIISRWIETLGGDGRGKGGRVVHIDTDGSFPLAESREEEGGVEVGLALGKTSVDAFCNMFGARFALLRVR